MLSCASKAVTWRHRLCGSLREASRCQQAIVTTLLNDSSLRRGRSILPFLLQVSMRVEVRFTKDALAGDETTEMRITLKEVLGEAAGKDYREE